MKATNLKMSRPKIRISIIDQLGKKGCHRGHKVGEVFDFDTERGELIFREREEVNRLFFLAEGYVALF